MLDRIQLDLKKGDFLYLVGGSGAGKSSLLRILATEELPSEGTIALFGYNLATTSASTLRAIRQAIGYVPQDVRLIPDLSVLDNVALSLSLAGRRGMSREARARIGESLEKLGLAQKRDKLASTLSGGEAQRVALARALVTSAGTDRCGRTDGSSGSRPYLGDDGFAFTRQYDGRDRDRRNS